MYDDLDLLTKIVNSLGIVGFSLMVVLAFFRGWVIPVTVNKAHEDEIRRLHDQITTLYEKRIAALESLLRERELRVEQNVAMLSTFIEAQDKVGQLAKRLEESHGN